MKYIQNKPLLTKYNLGDLALKNRIVMSSLTRGRATNIHLAPTALHTEYYTQRASAGLIITESVWVSEGAIGFINIPGIFSQEQVQGWKKVTDAVHKEASVIFLQIVHSGAVSHPDFLNGELPFGPSAINPMEKSFTPSGFKDTLVPRAYTKEAIESTINEFKIAAENALKAGFDGIELHAQLFTLIPQFLSEATNQRNDEYGGSIENRSRLLFEILEAINEVYPYERIGIKFTPAAFNSGVIKPDENTLATYEYILQRLDALNLAYVHLVASSMSLTDTSIAVLEYNFFEHFRTIYKGRLMANLGFSWETGNEILEKGNADLVSFGTLFIANPDLVQRFDQEVSLATADVDTYYAGEEKGYTDYPKSTK